ncbi:MAG: hypothetical protein M3Q99_15160 [Acidobacteriota bacterium]|nr:hypothetical protein [Acidobacteriota bacterium]
MRKFFITPELLKKRRAIMIEKASGNKKEAKRLLEKALKLNPAFDLLQTETARKTLEELS